MPRKFKPRPGRKGPPARNDSQSAEPENPRAERLQKILAAAGLGSRRKCEELITEGRVDVDGQVVSQLGSKADPDTQQIRVDGVPLPRPKLVHYLVHKPTNVVTTNYDPEGRARVVDLVPAGDRRLFAVGRLDKSSEGLILVTNDGALANQLTHPKFGVEKTYLVEVAGALDREELQKLRKGVHLAEGFAKAVSVRIKSEHRQSTTLEIVLDEGRNREIRRLLARVGHKALRLKRIAIGPLRLGDLAPGDFRPITREELRKLREDATPAAARRRHMKRSATSKRLEKPASRSEITAPRTAPIEDVEVEVTAQPRRGGVKKSRNARVIGGSDRAGGENTRATGGGNRTIRAKSRGLGGARRVIGENSGEDVGGPSRTIIGAGEGEDRPAGRPRPQRPSGPGKPRPGKFRPGKSRPTGSRRQGRRP